VEISCKSYRRGFSLLFLLWFADMVCCYLVFKNSSSQLSDHVPNLVQIHSNCNCGLGTWEVFWYNVEAVLPTYFFKHPLLSILVMFAGTYESRSCRTDQGDCGILSWSKGDQPPYWRVWSCVCNNCCVVFDPGSNKYQMILILLSVITKTKDRCSTRKFCYY
jgi:hypothetical protein